MVGSGVVFHWLSPALLLLFFPISPGWQVLAEKEEEQHGCQTLTWRSQVKGEPDHRPSSFPRARERGAAVGGRRATEGVWPLQERCGSLWSQIWTTVRDFKKQIHETVNGQYSRQHSISHFVFTRQVRDIVWPTVNCTAEKTVCIMAGVSQREGGGDNTHLIQKSRPSSWPKLSQTPPCLLGCQ